MEGNDNDPLSSSIEDLYNINLFPSELFFKFRKQIKGLRLGFNLEFFNLESNEYRAKLVMKPMCPDRRWKFIYEPVQGDVRVLSKKIPINKYINLQVEEDKRQRILNTPGKKEEEISVQVGIGHNFVHNATGWKWKLSTCLGGDGVSQIRNKTSVGLFPGFDVRIGWKAEYILPEIHGAVGTGEPMFDMNYGRLQASIDRVEAILTHTT